MDDTMFDKENSKCELKELIRVLKQRIKESHTKIKKIKRPKLLLSALRELDDMVGMDRLKNSVACQTMSLINDINSRAKNISMLNAVLYGPPGVGKSKVGIILSKIWYGLGFLKETKNKQDYNLESLESSPTYSSITLFIIIFIFLIIIYGGSVAGFVYNNYGIYWFLLMIAVIFIILFLLYIFSKSTKNKRNIDNINEDNDGNIISVVSRQDFVAGFVGQTATKTKALLTKNLGKVLFIDEAYSLLNDSRDSFGHEALTTLNLFLSEHPDEIVVIFAGYKEKLKNGIFKEQPGLIRRCMWYFECDGYNADQLCEIFTIQTEKDGWKLSNIDEIYEIIHKYKDMFKSYGGDTERLLFFSKLEASKKNFYGKQDLERTLTPDNVKAGIIQLLQNNITSDDNPLDQNKKTSSLLKTLMEKINYEDSLSNSY